MLEGNSVAMGLLSQRWVQAVALFFATMLVAVPLSAKGYLATRPQALPDLVLGTDITGYGLSQYSYELETGKAYKLKIISTGAKEYAWEAPVFFDFIWLRKVEAGGIEIKANRLTEIEFENEGEAEIFFVPIRPGTYHFRIRGLEERGMVGTFIVK